MNQLFRPSKVVSYTCDVKVKRSHIDLQSSIEKSPLHQMLQGFEDLRRKRERERETD